MVNDAFFALFIENNFIILTKLFFECIFLHCTNVEIYPRQRRIPLIWKKDFFQSKMNAKTKSFKTCFSPECNLWLETSKWLIQSVSFCSIVYLVFVIEYYLGILYFLFLIVEVSRKYRRNHGPFTFCRLIRLIDIPSTAYLWYSQSENRTWPAIWIFIHW